MSWPQKITSLRARLRLGRHGAQRVRYFEFFGFFRGQAFSASSVTSCKIVWLLFDSAQGLEPVETMAPPRLQICGLAVTACDSKEIHS